ncbi:DMT family transporter [Candidatus Cyanaurora vandensis]|uniref:DMT family transporter n=1 Tax=Candidatus Cyanaurora vandensis TaxID=2714958 RepID=UPI00257CD9F7|nr:EamA family transporter [Candidatus Cyanaurora vandensis]
MKQGLGWVGWVALWLAVLVWGGSFLATQRLVSEVTPLVAAWLRFSIASVLLLVLAFVQERKLVIPNWAQVKGLALYGLLAVTLCFTFENYALQLTSSGNASVVIGLIPVGTLLAAWWFLHETLGGRQWLGIVVATVGTLWLVGSGSNLGLSNPVGDGLMVLAMLCSVAAGLAGKQSSAQLSPLLNVGYSFLIGDLLLVPLALGEWLLNPVPLTLSLGGWLALLYLAVFASALAYTAYFYALSRISLSAATLPGYLIPVVTLGLAGLGGDEVLSLERGLAAVVVVVGLVLSSPGQVESSPE